MEGYWPSRQRRWKVLKIVVTTCFYLLRFRRRSDEWGNEDFGDADFRILSRTASVSSRKSLSALDVGLGEGDPAEEEPLSSLQTRKTSGGSQQLQTGHVYKLSTGMAPGDSFSSSFPSPLSPLPLPSLSPSSPLSPFAPPVSRAGPYLPLTTSPSSSPSLSPLSFLSPCLPLSPPNYLSFFPSSSPSLSFSAASCDHTPHIM